jgi:3-hydroxymyristoyl/3-hydroxydecanoyl-(acyl carrier protein) dehydratase/1-acyl-sn-glycerol-3-phosphate acyltransferase
MDIAALTARLSPPRRPPTSARSAMRLAAHMPPVRFAEATADADAYEVMAPAPPLPPVLDAAAAMPSPLATAAAMPSPLAAAAAAATHPPPPSLVPLAAVHAAFLRQQAAAHAEFLRILIGAPGGPPAPILGAPGGPRAPILGTPLTEPPATRPSASILATHALAEPTPARPSASILATHALAQPTPARPPPPVLATSALTEPPAWPSVPSPAAAPPARTASTSPRAPSQPTGPAFTRAELETLASGRISSVFGARFASQDGYARQVRMPEPPLLLADRVLGIACAPGEMGLGTIWTETDVDDDAWYLHAGRMPAGILVEAGQADLLLISWLGADAHNRGERVYRLLGCELTSHGELPRPGDRLRYEIHVDGHARQGDIRLFFFHYDCWVNGELRMTVRGGQAGFFSDAELAGTTGVLWSPDDAAPTPGARVDPPAVACRKHALTPADIAAFVDGRADACFGPGFERLAAHTRTPAIQRGRMCLLDEVTRLDFDGGPWRRGYLRAELALRSDHWFFAGHFKGDPCMPGTLMFEGCLQALATYLVALGFTLDRDGWRFEPVAEHTYSLRCRGQAVPTSQRVVYEVFVDEVIAAPYPTIFADLLGTVDGVRAFHCRRMGLRLVPDYPLDDRALDDRLRDAADPGAVPLGDARAMLDCAWGRPSHAFGDMYRAFDGPRRVPRLPGPPYHFMSRVTRVDGAIGERRVGSTVEVEYVVPPDAWYFADNAGRIPYCVLLEIALQPCGWLASYAGCALIGDTDRALRNLDGTGVVHRELGRDAGTLTTRATLVSLSIAAGIVVVSFDVVVRARASEVMTARTVFGLFDADSLKHQVGLPTDDDGSRAAAVALAGDPASPIDLARRAGPHFAGTLRLPTGRLLMLDRITALDRAGGPAGLGRIRAEKDVWPGDWFFRAHFFQDPVQPGSLGLDAMLQALEVLMIERGMAADIAAPRFEAIATGVAMTWKYRGQIVPENQRIAIDVAITRATRDAAGALAEARGSLYVDGKRIYEASGLAVRIVASGDVATPRFDPAAARRFWREATAMPGPWAGEDLMFSLLARFVGEVHIAAPLPRRARRGVVYLANHQVAIETLMAALVIGGLTETVPVLVAKAEHQHGWLGALTRLLADRPGFRDPDLLRFVDRSDPASVLRQRDRLIGELAAGRSVVVHVEGTRATSCRPVSVLSAAFVDLALEANADIVPLRFTGALPVTGDARLDFPVGYARQDYWFDRPIAAGELRGLRLDARIERVRAAINGLGPRADAETPAPSAPEFAARVADLIARGVPEPQAVLRSALAERAETAAAELSAEGRAIYAELARLDAGARADTRPWWAALVGWLCGGGGDDRVAALWGNERL